MAGGLFYTLAALSTLLFAAGIVSHVRLWLNAPTSNPRGGVSRVVSALCAAPRPLMRRRGWQKLAWEGVLQRQIWRESRLRWLIHISLSWGFVELFFATSMDMLIERGVVSMTKDTPWFALLNEMGGLLLILGTVLALYRRLVVRPTHLHTVAQDIIILIWLLLLGLGGYLAEAARFGIEGPPAIVARWSFVGYGLYLGLLAIGIHPADLMGLAWWSHAVAALGFVAVLPYTKLLHILTAPMVLVLDTAKSLPEAVAQVPPGWIPSPHLRQAAEAAGWDPDFVPGKRDEHSYFDPSASGGDP